MPNLIDIWGTDLHIPTRQPQRGESWVSQTQADWFYSKGFRDGMIDKPYLGTPCMPYVLGHLDGMYRGHERACRAAGQWQEFKP